MEAVGTLEFDAQLMIRVRDGDETSFALLLERHRSPVIHFLYRMIPNQAVAEELAQEVFLRVYKNRDGYEPSAKFTTWLYRIATNMALNKIRDTKRERGQVSLEDRGDDDRRELQIADAQRSVESEIVAAERGREIRAAVEALPANQRAAVLMHKYQGMDYAQIAKVIGCSESALKSLLFRAYGSLRTKLAHFAPLRNTL